MSLGFEKVFPQLIADSPIHLFLIGGVHQPSKLRLPRVNLKVPLISKRLTREILQKLGHQKSTPQQLLSFHYPTGGETEKHT